MTFKEYLKLVKQQSTKQERLEESRYCYVNSNEKFLLRTLSTYVKEFVKNGEDSFRLITEIDSTFALKGYKKILKELDIDYDLQRFKAGYEWAEERLSMKRSLIAAIIQSR